MSLISSELITAIYPLITNLLTGEKKLRIVSTPKGRGNKFADLWEHNPEYSKHKVTIEDAVRMGLFGPCGEVHSAECLVPGAADALSTKH